MKGLVQNVVGQSVWRVRTRAGVLLVSWRPFGTGARKAAPTAPTAPTEAPPKATSETHPIRSEATLLLDLAEEVARGNPQATRVLAALTTDWTGPPAVEVAGPATFAPTVRRHLHESPRRIIERALEEGVLSLRESPVPYLPLVPLPAVEPPPRPSPKADEQPSSFIEIALVDAAGKPVSNVRVVVELPDGQKQEARSGTNGRVRVEGFTQDGTAQVTFPDLDGDAIKQA